MPKYKVNCDIAYKKAEDNSLFFEFEVFNREIYIENKEPAKVFGLAKDIVETQYGEYADFIFRSIERVDKKSRTDYARLLEWKQGEYRRSKYEKYDYYNVKNIVLKLDTKQEQVLNLIKKNIWEKFQEINGKQDIKDVSSYLNLYTSIRNNVLCLTDQYGIGISKHDAFYSLRLFYENISPEDLEILNTKYWLSVDEYKNLKEYYYSHYNNVDLITE